MVFLHFQTEHAKSMRNIQFIFIFNEITSHFKIYNMTTIQYYLVNLLIPSTATKSMIPYTIITFIHKTGFCI